MMAAVLTNGDEENTMAFLFKRNSKILYLSIANILGDGNCLFAAAAHQLFQYPINSMQHKEATRQLRAKVVEYILANFESFEFILKNRVYEIKNASEITDITAECETSVRQILSRNGEYGAIKALSEIYEVNVITFLEDETYIFHNKENIHDKTVALAYRFGYENG